MSNKRGRPRKTQVYLTSDEIYESWDCWRTTGEVSDKMAKQMVCLAQHMLLMPQFNGYAPDEKEEMLQEACLKIIKNLKNMKQEKRSSFFSYWSCCCYSAFINYLTKKYRRINRKRKIFLDALQYAKDNNLFNVRPDIIASIQEQIDLYNAPEETGVEE